MPSVLAIHAGCHPEATAIAELRAGGVLATTTLDPLVATLVEVMTNPTLVVTAEVEGVAGTDLRRPHLATFWSNGSTAAIGHTDDRRQFQLIQIEPALLPFHLAQAVGVVPRPQPHFSGSFVIPAATLSKVESLVRTSSPGAAAELVAAGVAPHWADRLLAGLVLRRSLWTVQSVWLGGMIGKEESRMAVLDGGFGGYWRLSSGPDDSIVVAPTGFDELLTRMAALLP